MIVDGKAVSAKLKEKIVEKLQGKKKEVCFVIFGNNPSSRQFISIKCRFAESIGVSTKVLEYPETLSEDEGMKIISYIVKQGFDGIVVQLPLPSTWDTQKVLNLVPEEIDIDVLSDNAKEKYKSGETDMTPPVSRAAFEILSFYNIDLFGKKILVVGNGKLVGEPISNTLRLKNLPFDVVDRETPEVLRQELILSADIIFSGAGSPHFIKPDMVKSGAVFIDAGTSEQNGRLVGDFDPACFEKATLVTPVPNGVGPVTLACLFLNLK